MSIILKAIPFRNHDHSKTLGNYDCSGERARNYGGSPLNRALGLGKAGWDAQEFEGNSAFVNFLRKLFLRQSGHATLVFCGSVFGLEYVRPQ